MSESSEDREFRHRKKLGQNFLADRNILEKICDAARLSKKDRVLEIGPGKGSLTQLLAERAGSVVAVEKDARLEKFLRGKFSESKNVELVFEDALRTDFARFRGAGKMKLVSNLPYNISTQVLLRVLDRKELFSRAVIMLQKEVAGRISSPHGSRDYGSLSVLLQNRFDISPAFRVPRGAFFPVPKVESAVVTLDPLEEPRFEVLGESTFRTVARQAFSSRRKMIRNSLCNFFEKQTVLRALEDSGIDGERRAESLSVGEFARLSNSFHKLSVS